VAVRNPDLEIESAPREIRVVQRGLLWVAVPVEPGEVLPEFVVEKTRREIRDRKP